MPRGSSSRGIFVCYLVIVVIFMGLGRACRLGEILKESYGKQATKGETIFMGGGRGGELTPETTCEGVNLAIG